MENNPDAGPDSLRNEIQQYKETNNLYQSPKSQSDVDIAALKNLLKSSKSSLHRANQAVVQLKRELDKEKKLKRKAFQQSAIMKEKESRNNNAKNLTIGKFKITIKGINTLII